MTDTIIPGRGPLIVACFRCGRPTRTYPSLLKKTNVRRFCGKQCQYVGLSRPFADRVWEKVAQGEADSCWPWTGALFSNGYGHMADGRRSLLAHRVVYELTYGPINDDLVVSHRCDQKFCCNPAHLETKPQRGNLEDAVERGLIAVGAYASGAKLSEPEAIEARDLYLAGLSQEKIAQRFGVSAGAIQGLVEGKTWVYLGGPIRRQTPARLSQEKILTIRADYQTKEMSYTGLAKRHSVSRSQAWRAVNVWTHVE
mgnify:CR=1 FL=1